MSKILEIFFKCEDNKVQVNEVLGTSQAIQKIFSKEMF